MDEELEALRAALTELNDMADEAARERIYFAGRMAAEAILCAVPLGWTPRDLDEALARLREVDVLVWACAFAFFGQCRHDPEWELKAGRRHGLVPKQQAGNAAAESLEG